MEASGVRKLTETVLNLQNELTMLKKMTVIHFTTMPCKTKLALKTAEEC